MLMQELKLFPSSFQASSFGGEQQRLSDFWYDDDVFLLLFAFGALRHCGDGEEHGWSRSDLRRFLSLHFFARERLDG